MWQEPGRQANTRAESARTHQGKETSPGPSAALAPLIETYFLEAIRSLPNAQIEQTVRQWLSKRTIDPDDDPSQFLLRGALVLASSLLLFMPSLTGATPVDRFTRQRRQHASIQERAAMDALRRANFHLLRLLSRPSGELLITTDLATGETLSVLGEDLADTPIGAALAIRLAPLPDGGFVAVGPPLPLDAEALSVGLGFVRLGKGLSNPQRCAAAVYRHVVRHGDLGLGEMPDMPFGVFEDFAAGEEELDDDLDHLARTFARLKPEEEPANVDLGIARRLTSTASVIEALLRSLISRQYRRDDLAAGFARLALIMMETFERRAAAGSGETAPLNLVASALDLAIAERHLPAEARDLYRDLRRRLGNRRQSASSSTDELARVLQRIQALRAKTVDRGCTEQEALAAARKVAELLDQYSLSLGEVELRDQACEGVGIETDRRRRAPIDDCAPAIAMFCDCRVWSETASSGAIRYVFFGLRADVEAAHYLYDLIVLTFKTETASFKMRKQTVATHGRRRTAHSFQLGLAHGICDKLKVIKAERDTAMRSSGRDLVPLKAAAIEDELEKLGLQFEGKASHRKRLVQSTAYEAGRDAGRRFEPHRGVETTTPA